MKDNCYVEICGGVGNQLFQLAAGYTYSKRYDKNLIIDYTKWSACQGRDVLSYKDNVFKNFQYSSADTNNTIKRYTELRYDYDEIPYIEGDVSLLGYFQSLKYFEEYKDEFISLLNFPHIDISKIPGDKKKIAFHIRRGDYLIHSNIHHVCKTDYFNYFFDFFKDKDCQILVFTDSADHVMTEFSGRDFTLVKSSSDIKELALMSRCDTIVGSNSSFSWWASLMGGMYSYFPSKWFADGRPHKDIYRDDMILKPT
jgi:hypothetical protein